MESKQTNLACFSELHLSEAIMKALCDINYNTPSPIQAKTIPHVLEGRDVLGQAQTGTGKTAAFALPLLSKIDEQLAATQVLVLVPTRELAIQVADSFKRYAKYTPDLNIMPIYGGADYSKQLRGLRQGAHVVVGTPGRVMDHIERKSLQLDNLQCLVLDEADEMLRMGFIDDVEWVLERTPDNIQKALFSATMPRQIKQIVDRYLNDPVKVAIERQVATASTIVQQHILVPGRQKVEALMQILEAEATDGVIIFVKTRSITTELCEKLLHQGYNAAALNGDIVQKQREQIINQLKSGRINIVIATDVAARGLDVERISHVINYDMPHDNESYVHRIGRTGRAGRSGKAILFVVPPMEKRKLFNLERELKLKIAEYKLPNLAEIKQARANKLLQTIADGANSPDLEFYKKLIKQIKSDNDISVADVAAILASAFQGPIPKMTKSLPSINIEVTNKRKKRVSSDRKSSYRKDNAAGKKSANGGNGRKNRDFAERKAKGRRSSDSEFKEFKKDSSFSRKRKSKS